jgi:hypothetical protein
MEMGCFLHDPCGEVVLMSIGAIQLVESQPVERRLGGWCELAASLGIS